MIGFFKTIKGTRGLIDGCFSNRLEELLHQNTYGRYDKISPCLMHFETFTKPKNRKRQSTNRTMKRRIHLTVLTSILLSSCQTNTLDSVYKIEKQVSDSLKTLAVSFLRSWEPPFNAEKALSLFTKSEDFYLVIDGFETDSYTEWERGVPKYMADDDHFFKSYKHEIKDIKTVMLSPISGVVTITYIWDNISKEDVHKRVDGAITLACRREGDHWKIVHYHGSHGDEKIITN